MVQSLHVRPWPEMGAEDAEVPEKINYRSVGRGDGGVMRRRRPRSYRDPDNPTPSSIPSQYETTLYRDNRESKGFSSRASRFAAIRAGEVPGPGSYTNGLDNRQVVKDPAACVGKRGANAFASRIPRLDPKVPGAPTGPGDYEVERSSSNMLTATRNAPSAVFVEPASVNPAQFNARPTPGPGEYLGSSHPWSARGPVRSIGAYIPRSARMAPTGECAVPAAGASLVAVRPGGTRPASSPPATPAAQASAASGQSWGLPGPRRHGLLPQQVHAVPASPLAALSEAAQLKIGERLLQAGWDPQRRQNSGVPGPGDYDPQFEAMKGPTYFSQHGSSAFLLGTSHLPRKWRPDAPGPCEYHIGTDMASTRGAVLATASPRFKGRQAAAPGPAYYSPRSKSSQQSFHLNIQNNWV